MTSGQVYCYWITRSRWFFFQAEDGIRYLVRSRGLGDVYKRQLQRLTRDHTVVQYFVDAGMLSQEEAEGHPDSHILLSLIHI
mgnify:CR=1 FL=1